MKKILLSMVFLILFVPCLLLAQTMDYETITVADTAIGFTISKIAPSSSKFATRAFCVLETAEIRFLYSGASPTSTIGLLLEIGGNLQFDSRDAISKFKAIRTGSSSGVLTCIYIYNKE